MAAALIAGTLIVETTIAGTVIAGTVIAGTVIVGTMIGGTVIAEMVAGSASRRIPAKGREVITMLAQAGTVPTIPVAHQANRSWS